MSASTSTIVEIATLHRGENRFRLSPDESARHKIATRLGEPGIGALEGDFSLTPFSGGVDLALHITARVDRLCVASLEPMVEHVDERYVIRFERDFKEEVGDDEENGSSREPLEGDTLDIGEILVQHLSLSLAPHPRKEGAKSLAVDYRDPVNLSPFSGLKRIVDGEA
jgi:hypothetical protein